MQGRFKSAIRKGKVKAPIKNGFSPERWEKEWIKYGRDDKDIFEAGLFFGRSMSKLFCVLQKFHFEESPGIPVHRMLECICATSNRNISVAISSATKKINDVKGNIQGIVLDNNPMGNELTMEEVSIGSVDLIRAAIQYYMARAEEVTKGVAPQKTLTFIKRELFLSEMYETYSQYWNAIIWGDYSFSKTDDDNFHLTQSDSDYELSYEVSNFRKNRLFAQEAHLIHAACVSRNVKEKISEKILYIKPSRDCKRGDSVLPLSKAPFHLLIKYLQAALAIDAVRDIYPTELISKDAFGLGFSLLEALHVVSTVSLLATQCLLNLHDEPDEVSTLPQLDKFLVKRKRNDLSLNVSRCTGLSVAKTKKIIDFLTYNGKPDCDLWGHPLVQGKQGELLILLGAAGSPIFQRVLERWLYELCDDELLSTKGDSFEERVIEDINACLVGLNIAGGCEDAVSQVISICGVDEQIDAILKVGCSILVIEAKSIFLTDSPHSHFRAMERLLEGATQVERKARFISSNIKAAFDFMGWSYDKEKEYKVIPLVCNSNYSFSGFPLAGIPVVDIKIIKKYLCEDRVNIVSYFDSDNSQVDVAYCILHDDPQSFEENMQRYFFHPPQISGEKNNFSLRSTGVPGIIGGDIIFSRLVYNGSNSVSNKIEDILVSGFKVVKSEEFDRFVGGFNLVI